MLFKSKKIKKKGFTMLEVVFVCTIFAMLISGIILAINRTYVFMNNTRVQIRATNLTREGVEMTFNVRDTNRRKCSGKRDSFWLYLGSGATATNEKNCIVKDSSGKDRVFEKGIYTLKEGVVNDKGDKLIYAEKLDKVNTNEEQDLFYNDFNSFFSDDIPDFKESREKSRVTFTGTYTYLSGGVEVTGQIGDLLGNGVEYYRILRVYGIYCKNAAGPDDISCTGESDPKEMRFCVKTFYKMGAGYHASELCSIMTNFMG